MTDNQWNDLKKVVNGEELPFFHVGFIIDSPWLPGWYGVSTLDYYTNDEIFIKANLKAIQTFPEVWFLPGFWSEYGMCTEPSAFGSKIIFYRNEFPFAEKIIHSIEDIDNISMPRPETDGLLPFVLNRLRIAQPYIEEAGHKIRFSVSRGPLNIASFLMGTTEFLTACLMEPERVHKLLRMITDFLKNWHKLQKETFKSIDGIFILDDIVGFIGEEQFKEFALPYFKELYDVQVSIKFFHNDAECEVSAPFYNEIGINLYNPGIYTHLNKIKELTGNQITILGNIPPRDVLAIGPDEVIKNEVQKLLIDIIDKKRFILSCAGGMPPAVSTEYILALIEAAGA